MLQSVESIAQSILIRDLPRRQARPRCVLARAGRTRAPHVDQDLQTVDHFIVKRFHADRTMSEEVLRYPDAIASYTVILGCTRKANFIVKTQEGTGDDAA